MQQDDRSRADPKDELGAPERPKRPRIKFKAKVLGQRVRIKI